MASTLPTTREFLLAATVVLATLACGTATGAPRTFVASNGSDANPCSLPSPCRGFARALTQTTANGEIIVLDSAGYGTVTIDRSVTITAPPGVYAGISVFTGVGITVATPGAAVTLRGLTINGQGGTTGILFTAGGPLQVERCVIENMTGFGIDAQIGTRLFLRDVTLRRNDEGLQANGAVVEADAVHVQQNANLGVRMSRDAWLMFKHGSVTGNAGGGIRADVSASNPGIAQMTLDSTVIADNGSHGVNAQASDGNVIRVHAARSTVSRNLGHGFLLQVSGGTFSFVTFGSAGNLIESNGATGIVALGTLATVGVTMSRTEISNNAVGVENVSDSALIYSYSNNSLIFNGTDQIGTIVKFAGD